MSWVLFFFLPVIAGNLAFRAFRSRVKGGRFSVSEDGRVIQTALGTYTFDREAGKIHLQRPEGHRAFISLRDVRGVQIRVGFREATLEEVFIEGWNLTDLHADYRDHRLYWDVLLTTSHGAVPMAHMSQYKKRDWFDLATPIQHAILRAVGLYHDGADVAADLEDATRRALRKAGLNVLGGYDRIAPTGALDGAPMPTDDHLPKPPREVELPPPPDNPRWESVTPRR